MSLEGKIYDAFGELIYAVALADGEVQEAEIKKLNDLLQEHPWASQIRWSFEYEKGKKHDVDEVYKKVVSFCQNLGPRAEYAEMLDLITKVAEAFDGVDFDETIIIESFQRDLIDYFQDQIDKLEEWEED